MIPYQYALRRRMMGNVLTVDENTILLLHGEDLTDSSPYAHAITNNNVTVSTAQSKFGGSSLYFNGSSRLEIAPYNFAANDFTFDWWEYATASNVGTRFTTALSTAASGMMLFCYESNVLRIYATSSTVAANSWNILSEKTAGANIVNTWVHRAVVRSGSNILIFKNGTLEYTYNVGSSAIGYNASYPLAIGAYSTAHTALAYNFKGYIDEFRVSNVARWTENFMPPTKPYDNVKLPSGGDSGGDSITRTVTLSGSFRYGDAGCWVEIGGSVIESSGTYTVNDGDAIVLCALKRSMGALITIEVNGAVVASTSSAYQLLTYTLTATSDINVVGTIGENDAGSLVVTTV